MSSRPEVFKVDGPVRRTWASVAAVIAAWLTVLVPIIGQPILKAVLKNSSDEMDAWLVRLILVCVITGVAATVLAVIAVVRDRGTSRAGSLLLLLAAAVQAVFAVIGTTSTVLEESSATVFGWTWAGLSLVIVALASVFILIGPRPVTVRR
ncbi:hypothetical protein [Propionibacterium sp.]|uniref:hypothetical protein n=1 Tax=Propionibacterium sp. TaxID=1977903 RepID=UPI0039EB19FC